MADRLSAPARRARVLQLRAAGVPAPDIPGRLDGQGLTAAKAREDLAVVLRERSLALETGAQADALALERLDLLERRAQAILADAYAAHDRGLALRAVDRLLLIAQQRATVAAERPEPGAMEQAVQCEVDRYPAEMRGTPLAVGAVLLARRMDAGLPAQDLAGIAREVRITLRALGAKAPQQREKSTRDDLRSRREDRLKREAEAASAQ